MGTESSKVFVMTGALGAIGAPLTKLLAQAGGTLVLLVRDQAKAAPFKDQLASEAGNKEISLVQCDLGSTESIRKAAAEVQGRFPKIDVLFNNAAAFSSSRKTTQDGFEMQFGVNHLAPFLLTNLLEPQLAAAGKARVVTMSFAGAKEAIHFDDLMLEKYNGMTAYMMSKSANLYFTLELAERWKGKIAALAVDPGMVKTTLIAEAPWFLRAIFALAAVSPEKGAQIPFQALTSAQFEGKTGLLVGKKGPIPFPPGPNDAAARKRLWEESAKLVKL